MKEYTFASKLGILLATDVVITIVDSYIPHELSPIRMVMAGIILMFMAATMAVTIRYVLEDF